MDLLKTQNFKDFAQTVTGQLLRQKHASVGAGDAAEKRMLQKRTPKYNFSLTVAAFFIFIQS